MRYGSGNSTSKVWDLQSWRAITSDGHDDDGRTISTVFSCTMAMEASDSCQKGIVDCKSRLGSRVRASSIENVHHGGRCRGRGLETRGVYACRKWDRLRHRRHPLILLHHRSVAMLLPSCASPTDPRPPCLIFIVASPVDELSCSNPLTAVDE